MNKPHYLPTMHLRFLKDAEGTTRVLQQKWVAHDEDTRQHYEEWRNVPEFLCVSIGT